VLVVVELDLDAPVFVGHAAMIRARCASS
jgi:hypothetical protein